MTLGGDRKAMAEAATSLPATGQKDHSFLWRRLHSLSGVLPIGGYLVYHLYENLASLRSPAAYDEMVTHVNTMLPSLYFHAIEVALVGSILFHSLYGVYIASSGAPNVNRYLYGNNWAYWAQRLTGYLAFAYILLHVGVLRGSVTLGGDHLAQYRQLPGHMNLVTYNDVAAHLGNPHLMNVHTWMAGDWIFVAYLIGTLSAIYHFCNGLNGFCWTWGIAVGRVAQKRVRMMAWGLFVILSGMTLNMLFQLRFGA
jgi:succinate dehydrogenase / fumarate reductase cytochrome b subunit